MEILEMIFIATQFCGCFLELAAATSGGAAGYTGYQVYNDRKKRKQGIAADPTAKPPPTFARFLIWLLIAVGLIIFVILKWIAVAAQTP
jgi:hypothetical protein